MQKKYLKNGNDVDCYTDLVVKVHPLMIVILLWQYRRGEQVYQISPMTKSNLVETGIFGVFRVLR